MMSTIVFLLTLITVPLILDILDFILEKEAGLNLHDVHTVGGKSYAGITQKTWEAWRNRQDDKDNIPSLKINRYVR